MLFTIFQIAILLILPLVFIQSKSENKKKYLFFIVIVYIFWYLSYSFTHELSHLITAKILQEKVLHYQLVPKFWIGQMNGGYVNTVYTSASKEFFIVLAPYIRNLFLSIIGFFLIIKSKSNIYIKSILFLFCISSSLFDVFNNYFAYILGALNDFDALGYTTHKFVPHLIGIFFIITIGILYYLSFLSIIKKIHNSPSKNERFL